MRLLIVLLLFIGSTSQAQMKSYSIRTQVFGPTTFDQVVRIQFKISNSNFIYLRRFSIESWFYAAGPGMYNTLDCMAYIYGNGNYPLGQILTVTGLTSSVGDQVLADLNSGYPMATNKVPYIGRWPMPFGSSGEFVIEIQYMIPLGASYPLLTWYPFSMINLEIEDAIPQK